MHQRLLIFTLLLLSAGMGCRRALTPPGGGAAPAAEAPLVAPPPAAPTTLEDFRGRLALHNYSFSREGEAPALKVTLENLLAGEELVVEVRTEYLRGDGSVLDRTDWSVIRIPPRQRHHYLSVSQVRGIADARLLLRRGGDAAR